MAGRWAGGELGWGWSSTFDGVATVDDILAGHLLTTLQAVEDGLLATDPLQPNQLPPAHRIDDTLRRVNHTWHVASFLGIKSTYCEYRKTRTKVKAGLTRRETGSNGQSGQSARHRLLSLHTKNNLSSYYSLLPYMQPPRHMMWRGGFFAFYPCLPAMPPAGKQAGASICGL